MTNNLPRHLEGDYTSGPWKHTPQKLVKPKNDYARPIVWVLLTLAFIAFWGWVLT